MSCVVDDLRAVRELLSSPERWTQGALARDGKGRDARDGEMLGPDNPAAVCWCLIGAVERVGRSNGNVYWALRDAMGGKLIDVWNDAPGRTHAEVLALLDRAIEVEMAKEGVVE